MRKRVQAWIMAFIMLFTTVAMPLMDTVNVYAAEEEASGLKIEFHYTRTSDQDYAAWELWTWDSYGNDGYAEQFDENGVAVVDVPDGNKKQGFIVRVDGTWDKESNFGDRFVETEGYISGTIRVNITEGVEEVQVNYDDAVEGEYVDPATLLHVKFHYLREDGNYDGWGIHAWNPNDLETDNDDVTYDVPAFATDSNIDFATDSNIDFATDGNIDFATDDNIQFIAEAYGVSTDIVVDKGSEKVGFIVKYGDWESQEPGGNRFVDIAGYDSGTIHVYVTSGSTNFVVNYNEAAKDSSLKINFTIDKLASDASDWGLWLWDNVGNEVNEDNYPLFTQENNLTISYDVASGATRVGFIVRRANWAEKDPYGDDRFVDVSSYVSGVINVGIRSGIEDVTIDDSDAVKGSKVVKAVYEKNNTIIVTTSSPIPDKITVNTFNILCAGSRIPVQAIVEGEGENEYIVSFTSELDRTQAYQIAYAGSKFDVTMPNLYKDAEWVADNTYTGNDLGATWAAEKTTFKVWAPLASEVKVNIYEQGDPKAESEPKVIVYEMGMADSGVWVAEVAGDLHGKYYTYTVNNSGKVVETCDPYAKSAGINGDRAMVVNMAHADVTPDGWKDDKNPNEIGPDNFTDAVIYELHVRDASIDESSGVKDKEAKGNFLGLTKTGDNTILSHMVDLGVTHVHLLPVYDINSVNERNDGFNWGYDPKNYNVPEGSYSSDPYDGNVRVKEMREMVQTLHNNGISVVMDVVYNHVADAENFCFNQIVPKYFSRIDENGGYSSNSGCGNDTATEHAMVHKYIVDSITYWANEYHIDGFRFDLVGLIDTDTINALMNAVWATNPDVIFYGEGWEMNSYNTGKDMTVQNNADKVEGFAFFNDTFRDAVKGSVFDNMAPGWASGATGQETTIEQSFMGASVWGSAQTVCPTPLQTINYTSCHDNNTLYDRIKLTLLKELGFKASEKAGTLTNFLATLTEEQLKAVEDEVEDINKLIAAYTFTSQGVPFMHAAEEFLRTKSKADGSGYDHNSYSSGDAINSIKWDELEENKDIYEYYKGLIAFRKAHASLRMTDAATVADTITPVDGLDENVVAFEIGKANGETADRLFAIFNPNEEATTVTLPAGLWNVYVDGDKAGTTVLDTVHGTVTVDAISSMVLVDEAGTEVIPAEAISLDKTSATLTVGETTTLKATVNPAYATDEVEWSTSDSKVATVNNGVVKAVAVGTATITAKAGTKTATCTVTVTPAVVDVTGVTLDKTAAELTVGGTVTLVATVAPANATNKTVTWTSSAPAVATVDNTGKVTAVAAGTAVITAKAGTKSATCTITVKPAAVAVTSITLSKTAAELKTGETLTLTATVNPANATDKTVTWTTSDAKVATVSNGVVKAVAAGTATITATAGGKKATCTITVKAPVQEPTEVAVKSVKLNKTKANIGVGKTLTLKATINPNNATNKKVTWSTSNKKVATVDKNGKVTGKKAGTATITVKTANGKKATCKVTVVKATLNASSFALQVKKSTTALKVTSTLKGDKVKSWKSSNTKIVTVNKNGKVTAKSKTGKATITVTMKSGATAKCTVTVQKGKVTTKKLTIDKKKATVKVGKTVTLKVTRNPISATEKITWTTSNKKIATVDKNGKVTAKKAGTVTITAKTSNGKKVTCKVTVKKK